MKKYLALLLAGVMFLSYGCASADGFEEKESGAVIMDEDTRRGVLTAWQEKKQEVIRHPFLEEKIPWGLVPHAQALLLARYLRGDMDAYPPFLWK